MIRVTVRWHSRRRYYEARERGRRGRRAVDRRYKVPAHVWRAAGLPEPIRDTPSHSAVARRWAITEARRAQTDVRTSPATAGAWATLAELMRRHGEENPDGVRDLTLLRQRQYAAHLERLTGRPAEIDMTTAAEYRDERRAEGASARTIAGELAYLRHVLAWAHSLQQRTGVTELRLLRAPRVQRDPQRGRALEPEEVRRILEADLDHDAERFRRIVTVAVTTMLRLTPLLHLREDWLDREACWLTVGDGERHGRRALKGGRPIDVPLCETAMAAIGPPRDGIAYVFARDASTGPPRWFRRTVIALVRSGVCDEFSPNDLRRTGITWLELAGAPPLAIALLAGHETRTMTERYVRVDRRTFREAYLRPVVALMDEAWRGMVG